MIIYGFVYKVSLFRERRLCAALGKRVSPCGGHERVLLLPQRSKDILQDANKDCTYWVIMFFQKNVILMRYKCIFKIELHRFRYIAFKFLLLSIII